jgi:hypothetical protein
MKIKFTLFIALIATLISCSNDKNEKSEIQEVQTIKQYFVSWEANNNKVILDSDKASSGYAFSNSTNLYDVDMSITTSKENNIIKQANFGFYINDISLISEEKLVGKSFPIRLNVFYRDLSKNPKEQLIYQSCTDFTDNSESYCTIEKFEQIGESIYYLASGTFVCNISDVDESKITKISTGTFAMKIKK